jgi:hypothetical protein
LTNITPFARRMETKLVDDAATMLPQSADHGEFNGAATGAPPKSAAWLAAFQAWAPQ